MYVAHAIILALYGNILCFMYWVERHTAAINLNKQVQNDKLWFLRRVMCCNKFCIVVDLFISLCKDILPKMSHYTLR